MIQIGFIGINGINHSSIHFLPLDPSVGSRGGWSLSQQSSGERRGSPWTDRQSITGPHRDKRDKQPFTLTLTPKDNLESPINLTCMFLDGGRKPEYPEIYRNTITLNYLITLSLSEINENIYIDQKKIKTDR